MKILTNEYGYIVSYTTKGDLKDGIEIGHLDNPFEYQYIEGELIHNPIPEVPKGFIKPAYNGSEFVETATYEEIYEYERRIALKVIEDSKLDLVSEEDAEEVKTYIKALSNSNVRSLIYRPQIMYKYDKK